MVDIKNRRRSEFEIIELKEFTLMELKFKKFDQLKKCWMIARVMTESLIFTTKATKCALLLWFSATHLMMTNIQ